MDSDLACLITVASLLKRGTRNLAEGLQAHIRGPRAKLASEVLLRGPEGYPGHAVKLAERAEKLAA